MKGVWSEVRGTGWDEMTPWSFMISSFEPSLFGIVVCFHCLQFLLELYVHGFILVATTSSAIAGVGLGILSLLSWKRLVLSFVRRRGSFLIVPTLFALTALRDPPIVHLPLEVEASHATRAFFH